MNGEIIPPVQGYPLRVLNPGYYGVKQPAWVTEIEVIGRPLEDFWGDRGWDVSPPIAVDAVIFYPVSDTQVTAGDTLELGGAAFGGTRVSRVEVTLDHGGQWQDAEIVKNMDADNVWVFWGARVVFPDTGDFTLNVRATDIHGNVQPDEDPEIFDGTNDWPVLHVGVRP
jgi:DMSO/TMAO reductase YedYZ molybdopterin-dependent catalytic subunit